ncbi:hypothetical protein [Amylolactobacillus amylophilus]|nr:hypothetical protein [Amylolactobacillus amylophilus]
MLSIRKRHFNQIPLLEVFPAETEGQIIPAIVYYHAGARIKNLY